MSSSDLNGVQGTVWLIDLVTLEIIGSGLGEEKGMAFF